MAAGKREKEARNEVSPARVAAVRQFNRFHTSWVGALDEHLLDSAFSLPQARVLYELARTQDGGECTSADLAREMRVDPGYVSRLVGGLIDAGVVTRSPSVTHAKRQPLSLTVAGRSAFRRLDAASARQVASRLRELPEGDQAELVGAMETIRRLLGDARPPRIFVLREHRPGDLGWVVHRHAALYAREYGWDGSFEVLAAQIVGQFAPSPGRERCWIADGDGVIAGSVFLVRQDDAVAKLRLLYVEPAARGQGLGRRLVREALEFARAGGYKRVMLWTNDILVAARRIYEAEGFRLVDEKPHRSFGKNLVGQTWELEL